MRKACLAPAAALLAVIAPVAGALTPEELFEKVSPSVFMIHPADQQGKRVGVGSGASPILAMNASPRPLSAGSGCPAFTVGN